MKATRILVPFLFGVACTQAPAAQRASPAAAPDSTARTTPRSDRPDRTEIMAVMNRLFEAVDRRQWPQIASLMTDNAYTDYTALGGKAGSRTAEELVSEWQALLPGFDRTVHQPHNYAVWVAGDRATATLDAIATHYLQGAQGEDFWTVFVGYDTEFVRADDGWRLARIDLSLYDSVGNLELPKLALQRVAQGQVRALATTSRAEATVERFFAALEAQDLDALLKTLDKEVVQSMPLAPANFPKRLEGIGAMEKQYRGVMNYQQRYQRAFFATPDPNTVLVKFTGEITTQEGKPYNNAYVGLYTVTENGSIARFVEHFSPKILLTGWPGLKPTHYSMHAAGASTTSGVVQQRVTFKSGQTTLVGHLFLPPNFDANARYPAAAVTGSWTSVKEQMPDAYASLLAKEGFLALTFDFAGFGQSQGEPRQNEDYRRKIKDIGAAIDFLSSHVNVKMDSIAALGVCASSGYVAHAAAQDPRIKKVVLVAPWLHNPEIARTIYDGRPGGTDGLLASARAAEARYRETGEVEYVLAASELDPLAAMYVPNNAFDYYLNPAKAAGPVYDNRFAVMSWKPWLTFDGISAAKHIGQPTFIVHSEKGALPQGAKAFYKELAGPKKIVWLNDFNQEQLYYKPEAVHAAMKAVASYLEHDGPRK